MADNPAIRFQIDDMTCGHCVKTITNAIEQAISGTHVAADLESHIVTITGTADKEKVAQIITDEGYTPQAL
ncbi:MAG: Heavy-metal-associated domain-containing protein [Candidatus Tokpelaia hoelldobleri]|uniref:Heavy-metal-associated domain-containing protein n=1 Tax=Candidatus Tokpelaia hoelldobleri TaxID=1902579 RepID=A0A1U9JVA4_9HYPH|nr:MAG: Heavy-metal-associated domain-containing protein [Candidatus Tokpelaia hoelldoblerii]